MSIEVFIRTDDGREVPAIKAWCLEGTGRSPDSINVWEATVFEHGSGMGGYYHDLPAVAHNVTVNHRYGDGWPGLLREILTASELLS